MHEAVGAAEVHEDTEVSNRGDRPGPDVALIEFVEQALFLLGPPLLQSRALGQDHAVTSAVDLDHLEPELTTDLCGERIRAIRARLSADHLGHGDEGVNAFDVREQPALVVAGDLGFEDLAGLEARLQHTPALLAASAVDRQRHLTFRRLRLNDVHQYRIADRKVRQRIRAQRVHFLNGYDALGLEAHIDQRVIALDRHDRAFNDFTPAQLPRFGNVGPVEEGRHVLNFSQCRLRRFRRVGGALIRQNSYASGGICCATLLSGRFARGRIVTCTRRRASQH